MEKFEKVFFNSITKELKFFMRDYYSNYHNKNKWIGLLDLDEVMVGVIVVKDSDEEVDFNEAREYLAKSLNKPFILNLIILTSGEYINHTYAFHLILVVVSLMLHIYEEILNFHL